LALFRIGLAALIIGDLIWRARDLRAFYTDFGVLPRAVLLDRFADRWLISVHLLSGEALVQALMFMLAMVLGVMLLVGYRTKPATIASWALLISLQNRNPIILQGGDILLRMLLFWAMFLPLNAHFSFDRALDNSETEPPQRVFTIGSVALLAQVAFLYWFSAMLKSAPQWRTEGSAVYYALSLEQMATPVGQLLLQFPGLLRVLTFLTLRIETVVPLLLFWPFATGPVRSAGVILMVAFQLGLLVCLHLGHFPFVALVAVLGLLPTWAWSKAEERCGTRRALTVYYDGTCEFCRKMVRILVAFRLGGGTVIRRAQDDPQALAEMTRELSWVVVDSGGTHYFKSAALAPVLRGSLLWPLAWVLALSPARLVADRLYDWIAGHRSPLTRLVSPLRDRPLDLRGHWLTGALAAFFLAYVLWWNLGTVSSRVAMPDRFRWIGVATRTDQQWDMFAPYPLLDDGWYVIRGVLLNGREVDVFRDGAPVSFAKPSSAAIAAQYKDERWRKYLMNLYLADNSAYRLYYGRYLCRKWNAGKAADDPTQLITFDIYFMIRTNVPWTQPPRVHEKALLHSHRCR
jgi:predicted DCC family thiol-disulfide oxidoreductase YuxK